MKKIFKKSLAIMVSAAICLTALIGCLSVSATNGDAPAYTVATVEGKKGETVDVNVTGTDLTEICGQSVNIIFASGLEIGKVHDNLGNRDLVLINDETGGEYNILSNEDGTKTVRLVDIINFPEYGDTPALVTASFDVTISVTIPADAAAGKEYPITIDESQFADYDEAWVYPNLIGGQITVVEDQTTEPVRIDATLLQHDLLLTESVGSVIAVNVSANGGLKTLGYDYYYLTIEYEKYASGYNLETKTLTLNPEDRDRQNAAQTVDFFNFTDIALYEMPLDYTVTIYLKNAEGSTVAYTDDVTSITKQALAYAQKYSTDIKLLTTLADMVNYGASVQNFFATTNPGADIESAVLPTVGFEEYQQYASDASDLPEVFNTTKENIKKLESTTLQADASVLISSSNSIRYQFLATGYEVSELKAEISYTDSYGYLITKTVDFSDMELNSTGGRAIYSYTFTNLAIYDLEKTVSVSLKYNDSEELEFNYSVGNFVNTYINVDDYNDVLTKMELFSQSARIKLVGA